MRAQDINNEYFEWLCDLTCKNRYSSRISYKKLLWHLHTIEFRYLISRDANRAEDGLEMRHMFVYENDYTDDVELYIDGPCSVLEMMMALSLKCEGIMNDGQIGDRTKQWFWGMISNLGLGSMTDDNYNDIYVEDIVNRFLDRDYEPDGRGGLFTVRNCEDDLRDIEIWHQLCWYLDNIANFMEGE